MRCIEKLDGKTGKPLLQSIRIGEPCADCKKTVSPQLCTHNIDETPAWKSKEKLKEFEIIMSEYQDINKRENYGMVVDSRMRLFPESQLDILRNMPLVDFPEPPKCVYLAVDPAGGGKCEFGLCAAVFFGDQMVVCFYLNFLIWKIAGTIFYCIRYTRFETFYIFLFGRLCNRKLPHLNNVLSVPNK